MNLIACKQYDVPLKAFPENNKDASPNTHEYKATGGFKKLQNSWHKVRTPWVTWDCSGKILNKCLGVKIWTQYDEKPPILTQTFPAKLAMLLFITRSTQSKMATGCHCIHNFLVKFSGKTPIQEVEPVSSHDDRGIPICQPSSWGKNCHHCLKNSIVFYKPFTNVDPKFNWQTWMNWRLSN